MGLDGDKSQLLPYGVDVQRYGRGEGATARDRLGIPPGAPVIGALGRLVHKKGFDVLLDALPPVLAAYPEAYCVIGGQGDLMGQLSSQAQALGIAARVLFPGHIGWQETPDYYAMCDIVTVPSIIDAQGNVDGLPNVLLEALASGCAVVGSDVAGIPSVIEHGRNGLLCPPGDKSALAEALLHLLADHATRARLGQQARQDMAAAYDWSKIAARLSTIYEQALGKAV